MMNLQQEMSRICSHIQRLTGIRCTLLEAPDGQWPDFPCSCGSCQTVIHEVSRCIESHLTEKIALEEAAAHVHFSRSCLCRIIKGEAGCTFTEYLNQLRIERSKTYLYRSHLTLAQIASRTGFEDQSDFTRIFKRYAGIPPGRFRMLGRGA